MEGKEYFKFLLDRYGKGQATEDEQQELFFEIQKNEGSMDWAILLEEHLRKPRSEVYDQQRWEPMVDSILTHAQKNRPRIVLWTRIAAAIVIGLMVLSGIYLLLNRKTPTEIAKVPEQTIPVADVAPGGDKAVLKLADGTEIVLDSTSDGVLTQQGGIKVINLDGQLAYKNGDGNVSEVLYNTITTPRGGQYQLVLADGTKVWLNAASWLRFPTAFPGEERIVELRGEGYFEVAHNASKPFHVKVGDMDVQVLGTHFNINSYSDEPSVKTTLLEGRVKVEKNDRYVYLNPGQQAVLQPQQGKITVETEVDVEQVIAWKDGFFRFNHTDLQTIMRQIARWYNVDVVYTGPASKHYNGKIYRESNISKVLQLLEKTGTVKFVIEGKKIIVNTN